jgi:5-formyltetrahydrofolate cyclo-ligase
VNIREEKSRWRREIKARLAAMPCEQKSRESGAIVGHVQTHPVWREAGSILLYAPLPGEADIWPLVESGLAAGKRIFLPRRAAGGGGYEIAQLRDPGRDLLIGDYGAREPNPAISPGLARELDFALVPGLGFDKTGGRLGRGLGHFDRLLSETAAVLCGVAFAGQIIAGAPIEDHDVLMNYLVTPEGWIETRAATPGKE